GNRRAAQSRGQHGDDESHGENAHGRARQRHLHRHARRLRQAGRRGNREVGQGRAVRRSEGGLEQSWKRAQCSDLEGPDRLLAPGSRRVDVKKNTSCCAGANDLFDFKKFIEKVPVPFGLPSNESAKSSPTKWREKPAPS